jgi:acyl-CoA synthetase (AMP-forming)/AMP-acid ligase II
MNESAASPGFAPETLFDLLRLHLGHEGGERPLLVTAERSYSSRDIDEASARLAGWLLDAGVKRGDRVVVDLKNGLEAIVSLFAVARIGGVTVCATPQWSSGQLSHLIADAGAEVLVTSDVRARQLRAERPRHVLTVGGECEGATPWAALDGPWAPNGLQALPPPAPDEPAVLIYTSGTTGLPKGVVHPHKNLVDFARIVSGYLGNTIDDRLLWVLGWSFGYGMSQLLTMCQVGGRLILPESMLAADVLKAHEQHHATGLAQVPYGWDQLVSFLERTGRRLEGLRYVTNAGDGPTLALLDRLEAVLAGTPIILMYGQTECFRTTYLPSERYAEKRCAMGYAIPEVEVHVLRDDGTLADPGEPGELVHGGALLSPGYFHAPEATARKFRPVEALGRPDRMLHTGDIVRQDADGCLWYVARSERMIKSSGFRFGPGEIEAAARSVPAVHDAVAFGVADANLGQAVELAVTLAPGDASDREELVRAIQLSMKQRLPRYMLPRGVHVLDAMPRTATNKIDVLALQRLAQATSEPSRGS